MAVELDRLIEREDPSKRRAMFRSLFAQLDTSGEGFVDVNELKSYLSRLRDRAPSPLSNDDQQALLNNEQLHCLASELAKTMDTSGDGKISYEEFEEFVLRKEKHLFRIFQEVDANKNGELSKDEVHTALRKSGLNVTKEDVEKFFKVLDRDSNGGLDFYELRDAFFLDAEAPDFSSLYTYYHSVYDPTVLIDGLPTNSPPNKSRSLADQGRFFLAGGIAGAISRTLTAPMDRLRTFYQTSTKQPGKGLIGFARGMVDAGSIVYEREGIKGFWRGNGVNVFKVIPESALTFWAFENLKERIAKFEGRKDPSAVGKFFAGGISGMFSMFAIYPVDTIRTRLMCLSATTHTSPAPSARPVPPSNLNVAVAHAQARAFATSASVAAGPAPGESAIFYVIKSLWASGIPSFYRGALPACIGIFPYQAVNLLTFDTSKEFFVRRLAASQGKKQSDVRPGPGILLGCGALSSTIGSLCTYPFNLLRIRLQAQGSPSHPQTYTGVVDCLKKTIAKDGFKGLYRGQAVALLKSIPSTAISYYVYETTKAYVGIK
ncbi:mitochondrial carrier [Gonapodya prolifera JEL478]|uniref:Mitochondrial carrier n=1 Tax=Gonapodya prolifera (strain JEL478) TaxID=1344416 RepID=A0A139AMK0_GONPJ|nr:mitochondrial carrier [Gonapodya prolifera JEL478]|eukprot:KXS17996.1 mitochondrial carrier [Gonapodya prolifera JEL478]